MDKKEDQNIINSNNKNVDSGNDMSINENEKNIYPFSERINFKYNFENNLKKDFSSDKLLIAKNKNTQYEISDFESEPLNLYEINENSSAYYEIEDNWISDINLDYLSGKLFSYKSDTDTKNDAPIKIKISQGAFNENINANSFIGSFSTIDANLSDSHNYKLISGKGDDDNDLFYLSGNDLYINHSPNFEWKSSYSIRLSSVDSEGFIREEVFNLNTNNLEDHGRKFFKGNSSLNSTNTWSQLSISNAYLLGNYTGTKWGDVDPDSGEWTDLEFYLPSDETINFTDYGNLLTSGYFHPLSNIERNSYLSIFERYEDVCRVTFTEAKTYSLDTRNILFGSVDSNFWGPVLGGPGLIGRASFPTGSADNGLTTMVRDHFAPYLNSVNNVYGPGSWLYAVAMHELGHSMGLAHPHDGYVFPGVTSAGSTGSNGLNSGPYTVMTYNMYAAGGYTPPANASHPVNCGCMTCLGAFDIAHLQYLYGPNQYNARKDDSYMLSDSLMGYECIWDAAGKDTIDASTASKSSTIDLRNATLQNEVGGGGFVSEINGEYKGFTIAYNSTGDCIIENAIGSNFNDRITGNEYSNTIYGLNGADEIFARGGSDFVYGGVGDDVIHGSFYGDPYNSVDTLTGGRGSDYFVLGDSSGLFYTNSLLDDFANITDFDFLEDKLRLKGSTSYLTSITSSNNISGLGIFKDNNSSGNVDSNDDLIAIISNKKDYLSFNSINTDLV